MNTKVEKLRNIVINGRNKISDQKENSFTTTPIFDFELTDINLESENSIIFKSIDEAVTVIKESGVTSSESEIKTILETKIGNISSDFKLNFF